MTRSGSDAIQNEGSRTENYRSRTGGLERLNIFSLVLSTVLLVYTVWVLFYTERMIIKILSVAIIIYYLSVIPVQYMLLGKKCYCESFISPDLDLTV